MLNKLLKRCAPWMDKGRWMQIRVVGADSTDLRAIYNDNEIESVTVDASTFYMNVTLKHVARIIDYKVCPENDFDFIVLPNQSITAGSSSCSFDVRLACPGTYWFFMR